MADNDVSRSVRGPDSRTAPHSMVTRESRPGSMGPAYGPEALHSEQAGVWDCSAGSNRADARVLAGLVTERRSNRVTGVSDTRDFVSCRRPTRVLPGAEPVPQLSGDALVTDLTLLADEYRGSHFPLMKRLVLASSK